MFDLKKEREKLNLSRKQLCEEIKLIVVNGKENKTLPQRIYDFETGRRKISMYYAIVFSVYFKADLREIVKTIYGESK